MSKQILLEKLRDPIWQSVGAIVTVVGVILSILVAYDVYVRSTLPDATGLNIRDDYLYQPFIEPNQNKERIQVLFDDQPLEALYVQNFTLFNYGTTPIAPEDFKEPIRVSAKEPWRILLIDTGFSTPDKISLEWTEVTTNTFELHPTLLNHGDTVQIVVYLTHKEEETWFEKPEFDWTARIVNVASITTRPAQPTTTGFTNIFYEFSVYHEAAAIYLWFVLSAILGFTALVIARNAQRIAPLTFIQILLVLAIAIFSFITGEVITDLVITDEFLDSDAKRQATIAWMAIIVHVILLLYIGWPTYKRVAQRVSNSLRQSSVQG